jgi:tetratricopeptide (TPR) repeat protein
MEKKALPAKFRDEVLDIHTALRAGIAAYRHGDYATAAEYFSDVLAVEPSHQAARINIANALWALKDFAAAAMHAQIALAADPRSVEALMIAGAIRLDRGDARDAVAAYREAAKRRPKQAGVQAGLAAALLAAEDPAGAERAAKRALKRAPGDPHAWFTLGSAKLQQHRTAAALEMFDALIAADPGHGRARHNRANALIDLNRLEEAGAELRTCLGMEPGLKEAWATLGYLLTIQGELAEAIAACEQAIALDPDFAVGQWNRGVALLLNGDFAAGFAAYEWRKRHPVWRHYFSPLPGPVWRGEALKGRHLLIRAEQGFGDTIMLSRFFPALAVAARQVTLCCKPSLFPLFREMNIELLALDATPPVVDLAVDQMSLPHILRLSEENIPDAAGYLRADASRVEALGASLPSRPRIGLVWAGNTGHDNDRRRSLPPGVLRPLFDLAGLSFVSLQIGAREDEYRLPVGAAAVRDYGDTAAIISQLDAVVGVDTSVVHLAGALGIPCHVLLSTACDWRWRLGRDSTAWYDSLTLHRQIMLDDWAGPIASVLEWLRGRFLG